MHAVPIRENLSSLSVHSRYAIFRDSFNDRERRVMECILAKQAEMSTLSIQDIAAMVNVAVGTVVRACKKIGYSGFRELKLRLIAETPTPTEHENRLFSKIEPTDDLPTVINKVYDAHIRTLRDTRMVLTANGDNVQQTAVRLLKARRVAVFGIGSSGNVAREYAVKLMRLGLHITYSSDPAEMILNVAQLGCDDMVIAISHSGKTKSVIQAVQMAKNQGCFAVVITSVADSPLALEADMVLPHVTYEAFLNPSMTRSIVAPTFILDLLIVLAVLQDSSSLMKQVERTVEAQWNQTRLGGD